MRDERRNRIKKVLEDMIERDPESAEADVAKIRLQEMESNTDVDFDSDTNDSDGVLITSKRWKDIDYQPYSFCFKANSTYKHALKKFLKRKKWLIDDVLVCEKHGIIMTANNLAKLKYLANHPDEWCPDCIKDTKPNE